MNPASVGVATDGVGTHHRAGACAAVLHADGEAVEGAEAVEESLHLARRHGERLLGALVDDQHGAVVTSESAHRAQDPDRIGHVVEHLDRQHEVVGSGDRRVGGVSHLEPNPVTEPGGGGVLVGDGDGCLVEIEPVDLGVRMGAERS